MKKLSAIIILILTATAGSAQRYKDVFPRIAQASDEEALALIKGYLVNDLDHPNCNLRLALIYENRYNIWIMGPKGIISKNIFGHRLYELSDLSTTQLVITFILEIQDFLLPKLYTLVQVLMKAIFYIISGPIKSKIRIIWKSISSDFS